ncbi:MAG: hypothetical protein NZ821_07970 [Gloeomargarita sp. SKYB31]|nr:hypothetical protein [Gloeomargarita sp. SKYB31]
MKKWAPVVLLAVVLVWASEGVAAPRHRNRDDDCQFARKRERRFTSCRRNPLEIRGFVQGFDPRAGWILVNGQWFRLANRVDYDDCRPRVGDFVAIKAYPEAGQWVVYKVELKD